MRSIFADMRSSVGASSSIQTAMTVDLICGSFSMFQMSASELLIWER